MALERFFRPSLLDDFFFDDILYRMNQDVYRRHNHLNRSMIHLLPSDFHHVSRINNQIEQMENFFHNALDGVGEQLVNDTGRAGDARQPLMKNVQQCITTKDDGSRELKMNFDLNAFKPEEINVKTKGKVLSINAKHEEKNENSQFFRQFSQSFTLPDEVDAERVECSLTKDGVMTLKAPCSAPAIQEAEKPLPIKHE